MARRSGRKDATVTENYYHRDTYECSTCGGDKPNDWCMTCGGTGVVTIAQTGFRRFNIYRAMAYGILFSLDIWLGWHLFGWAMKWIGR